MDILQAAEQPLINSSQTSLNLPSVCAPAGAPDAQISGPCL